uniref:Uncharacterized protein n=1 Tax=Anguilla anguilla TaxID=7936 RepID=A0A0E9P9G4_ANGAN
MVPYSQTTVYRVRGKIIHRRCYIVPYYL